MMGTTHKHSNKATLIKAQAAMIAPALAEKQVAAFMAEHATDAVGIPRDIFDKISRIEGGVPQRLAFEAPKADLHRSLADNLTVVYEELLTGNGRRETLLRAVNAMKPLFERAAVSSLEADEALHNLMVDARRTADQYLKDQKTQTISLN